MQVVGSFARQGNRVTLPPAPGQAGRAGADHLTGFEQTNKVVPPLLPEGDAIVRSARSNLGQSPRVALSRSSRA